MKRCEQLFQAVAYGDAAGLPFETMTPRQIRDITSDQGSNKLLPTKFNDFYTGEHDAGTWSDDTELTLAVAKGLMNADGFDIESQAEAHVNAYNEAVMIQRNGKRVPRGWGGSTTDSVVRLMRGTAPHLSGATKGAGNGVVMKQAPLAYWHYARNTPAHQRESDVEQLTIMTHCTDVAVVASLVHSEVLDYLLKKTDTFNATDFIEVAREATVKYERQNPGVNGEVSKVLCWLSEFRRAGTDIVRKKEWRGFMVPETLVMAYGSFLINQSFPESSFQAISLGGDTDSTASIVASMSNMLHGELTMPDDAGHIKDAEQLLITGRAFVKAALREE